MRRHARRRIPKRSSARFASRRFAVGPEDALEREGVFTESSPKSEPTGRDYKSSTRRVRAGPASGSLPIRVLSLRATDFEQALKGIWWMPWHREAMKDVAPCEKLREGGSNR